MEQQGAVTITVYCQTCNAAFTYVCTELSEHVNYEAFYCSPECMAGRAS